MKIEKFVLPLMVMVLALLPVSSAQIVVDGNKADWIALNGTPFDQFEFGLNDVLGDLVYFDGINVYKVDYASGFDLKEGHIYFDVLKLGEGNLSLYFMLETNGTIGDATGDGNPSTGTRHIYPGSSEVITEGSGGDIGNAERYEILIDFDKPLDFIADEKIVVGEGDKVVWDSTGDPDGLTAKWSGNVLEVGAVNVGPEFIGGFGFSGFAGSTLDYWSEDYLPGITPCNPVADFSVTPFCNGSAKFISESDPCEDSFLVSLIWDFGDGSTSSGNPAPQHQYAAGGTYTVKLTVTNAFGNTDDISKSVTVGNGSVTVNAGPDKTIVKGACVTIGGSPTASGGDAPYTYEWSPAAGLSATNVANPEACPTTTTTYTVSVKDSNPYVDKQTCWGSDSVTIKVVTPGIELKKFCPPGGLVGETVTYSYSVTNTGETDLINVNLTDDKVSSITYVSGDNGDGKLNPGETWSYRGTYVITTTSVTNVAKVTANDVSGAEVSDSLTLVCAFNVPAMSVSGLITLSAILGIISLLAIRKKEW